MEIEFLKLVEVSRNECSSLEQTNVSQFRRKFSPKSNKFRFLFRSSENVGRNKQSSDLGEAEKIIL